MKRISLQVIINNSTGIIILMLMIFLASFGVFAQTETAKLLETIETYPDSLPLHQQYIKESGLSEEALEDQYNIWLKKFSKSATVPFALGEAYYRKELPAAKLLLLKALERDPALDKAYFYLWIDGERWGDFEKSREYLLRAKEIAPDNPNYAFYYAGTFSNTNPKKYRELSLEVAHKFPKSERGAQSLYWLAERSSDKVEKKEYYELLKNNFPPETYSWSSSGMYSYFDLLLEESSKEAVLLAQNMVDISTSERDLKTWKAQMIVAKNVNKAKDYMAQDNSKEAMALLENTTPLRWSNAKDLILLLKAKAMDKSGKTKLAYDALKMSYAKSPEKRVKKVLKKYGLKLNKSLKDIENDIWFVRDTISEPATDFTLKNYLTPGKTTLSDLKDKVILLTYWFPGCGPCRGEFPHFQSVVDKFEGQDLVYLGINIVPDQNDYVIPFMKSSGYSFIPLEDYPDRDKGNLDNRGAAPMNFIIDRNGNLMFSNFRTNEHNQDVLEEMIASLLNRDNG
ncbi:TlpA disulfide reductase family protein [Flavivirga spongiicola]|uniref:TlpA family protein disulfide reductase n=1 Tax=Flavivirga spongiicola TaxID=421621 RepID=A0ABU7XQW2_9FLAO|nr:TlpA disulfide reductase family protein [Flavivirga sp. MEBiC05379]MDO5977833.1 TlpA disulfide reductase family protein [Flavivirga sp. MEBiC05379]